MDPQGMKMSCNFSMHLRHARGVPIPLNGILKLTCEIIVLIKIYRKGPGERKRREREVRSTSSSE